ncbi:lipopolysaccharide biosynthesis protein [Micromonospora sp. NBC_00362]|uniref:lipopolysaccharide biosynthesis protein n=1 Tax=unclassified Micromonospora TaxID=2617518 RepID=UPI00225B7BE7|nr:lipopolysaccharide biosynthesis protein [Micromonospora sp. NBC_00362]MCX5117396.1 lipopolysaccharide biosynthesis protein [Micromonospora sp. NBC_00362]WTI10514.1 lipopolysaccharide biosynthesis protein [Micromonospora sp. NBC_00821]
MTDAAPAPWPTDGPSSGTSRAVTLTDLLRVPMHRLRLVAAVAMVGLLAALGYVLLVPAALSASAVVAVRPVVTDAFTPSGAGADRAVNMNVESGIATGTEVVQRLADSAGGDPRDIRDALEVEVPTGGQILRFTYQARESQRAVQSANMAAEAYLSVRRAMYEQQRAEMLRSYDASITKVAAQQTALQRRANTAKDTAAGDALVAELAGINNQLTQLNAARTEIAAVDVNPGWVTQTAEKALVTSAGHRPLYLVAGLLGGALIGIVLAYLWESTDRRVRSVADGREASGLPLLGTVRRPGFRGSPRAVDADVRYVAMAVAERVRQPARVALVTAREDATVLTAGLAVALAVDGREVFVADDSGRIERLRAIVLADRGRLPIDPSRPLVPKPRPAGSTPATAATTESTPARRPSPHPPGARPSTDPDATLTLPRVSSARPENSRVVTPDEVVVGVGTVRFGTWRQGADHGLVLFNAPPAESDERGVAVARQGSAVVVVERDRTRQSDLRRLVERLRAAGVTPLGFVLTRNGRA